MKKLKWIASMMLPLFFASCIIVDNTPGPRGRDGLSFFGVDYEHQAPYSYWDNNSAVPYNPALGHYYQTRPGVYNFEYFINAYDYWYGTYEVWYNPGGPGGPHGEPGYDGRDEYLMLICDPNGFHEHRDNYRIPDNEVLVIEKNEGTLNFKLTIQKGNILTRTAQQPKYKRDS
ncbi:MAG: hypothetical protein KDD41_01280 [Flavobacteriales bacterium]|nr:hypothetical protein [Flavobacteriales bacterium]